MRPMFLFIMCLLINWSPIVAQECGAYDEYIKAIKSNPQAKKSVTNYLSNIFKKTKEILREYNNPRIHRAQRTIPVVVHIVHKDKNIISDAQVRASIRELTKYFRKRNKQDLKNVPKKFRNLAMDSYIGFELAKREPSGKATTGIKRYTTSKTVLTSDDVKLKKKGGANPWDDKKYLNIWVCDLPSDAEGHLLGVGTFPENPHEHSSHGVVVDYAVFPVGPNSTFPNKAQGKVLVHEVGHFLGLRHIWGDTDGSDFVDDTPHAAGVNGSCPSYPHRVSSKNSPHGEMFMNYMDYVNDECMHLFTRGQVARMLANLAPGGKRASLLSDQTALIPVGTKSWSNWDRKIKLEASNRHMPSWKASFLMTCRHLFGYFPNNTKGMSDSETLLKTINGANYTFATIKGIPQEISQYIGVLGYSVDELITCYTPQAFYDRVTQPVILLSVGQTSIESYGLVIKGLGYHEASNSVYLRIFDPLNTGPKGFNFKYENMTSKVKSTDNSGSEYIVKYNLFMNEALDEAARANKKLFLLYPPSDKFVQNIP